jgi:hypothetical protein
MFGNKKKQQAPEAPKRKGAALANQVNITENHRSVFDCYYIDRIPQIFPQRNVGQPREVSYLLLY